MDAAATLTAIKTLQTAFSVVQTLNLAAWRYSPPCTLINHRNLFSVILDETKYDFIIVGAGTAGSVLANRLSKHTNTSVLLVEVGGYPPVETDDFPGLFPILPRTVYDYNFIAQNDHYSAQNLQNCGIGITQGKVLGGSGSIQHLLHVRGNPEDFNEWAKILDDDSWNYTNILPYFKKMETLTDKEILASPNAQYHGTTGPMKVTRNKSPFNVNYLAAFKELGNKVEDTSPPDSPLGYFEPLYNIADGIRQSTSLCYLGLAKTRPNLCIALFTTVTKILIKNGTAIGVQMTMPNGDRYIAYAKKEVIVSAGAINSPKLLMLSGIGPKSHLKSFNIKVHANLPVGKNFKDHCSAIVVYQMEDSTAAAPPHNPHLFPVPTTVGCVAFNSSQTYPDYLTVNLVLPHDSEAQLQICINMFKYSKKICQKFFNGSKNRTTLFVVNNLLMPKSLGKVLLASANPHDYPLIYPRTFTDRSDLKMLAKALADYHRVIETSFFKKVNASMIDVGLCSKEDPKFWECYALSMSSTMWHYCGTCAMGVVLDSKLCVKGIRRLRVVDSSSMPTLIRGKIHAAVVMIAEKAADLIHAKWNI